MFNVHKHRRKRVQINRKSSRLNVRIERQNLRGVYFWIICLTSPGFGLFCSVLWDAPGRHAQGGLSLVLVLFALGLVCYVLAIAISLWGAFGVEDISVEAGSLLWTRTATGWNRTREIRIADVTGMSAITPWYGLDNSVELTIARKHQRMGDRLLRDEAIELAQQLRRAVGLRD